MYQDEYVERFSTVLYEFTAKLLPIAVTGINQPRLNKDIFFEKDIDLSKRHIKYIKMLAFEDQIAVSENGTATTLYQLDVTRNIVVTFCNTDGREIIRNYPINLLSDTVRSGKPFMFNGYIDFGKSYISIKNMTGLTTPCFLLFQFYH